MEPAMLWYHHSYMKNHHINIRDYRARDVSTENFKDHLTNDLSFPLL